MTAPIITVDGTITRIVQLETRKGSRFIRLHVTSDKLSVDVDVFDRSHQGILHAAMPGDRLKASGPGFHRGAIRGGSTSITARTLAHKKDLDGRARRTRPHQMDLFAA